MQYRLMAASELAELDEFRNSGLILLRSDAAFTDLLGEIDERVVCYQEETLRNGGCLLSDDELIDLAWALGTLLGDQFVERLGWAWSLIGSEPAAKFGILSANGALALYPSFFVRDCIANPSKDFTGYLIFNMVSEDRFSQIPADTCLDLADTVMRIVPRDRPSL